MSPRGKAAASKRQHDKLSPPLPPDIRRGSGSSPDVASPLVAMTSSLDTIHIAPRTPRSARHTRPWSGGNEVELSLLGDDERRAAENGLDSLEEAANLKKKRGISPREKRSLILLTCLYLIQGVPLGLALGSIPFLLRETLSYSQLATFALSSYPYSLKLLWSPVVDSLFISSIGRRKSWIIPMQMIIGTLMVYISFDAQKLIDDASNHVYLLTFLWTSLVAFAATQDIAVDGWALTLLSPENVSYASTAQTIGLNTGYFASFTVFLAFNSEAFSQKWGIPRLLLSTYLRFWSIACYGITLWLIFVEKESKELENEEDMSMKFVYRTIWDICKLPHIQTLIIIHCFAKFGWAANEAVTHLKMVEKGLGREDLAIAVLIDFPFQILFGYLAARWSKGDNPLRPWLWATWPRLGFAVMAAFMIYFFPKPPISMPFFLFIIAHTCLQSLSSTVQFVGIAAFHNRISDPLIGGTYMTLLATFTNLGGTWPKWFVLKAVDIFTVATCKVKDSSGALVVPVVECVSEHGKSACSALKGECVIERDGYFLTTGLCIAFGVLFMVCYIMPKARRLQTLPVSAWRIHGE